MEVEWLASRYGRCTREKSSSIRLKGDRLSSKTRFDLVTVKEITTLLEIEPEFPIHNQLL